MEEKSKICTLFDNFVQKFVINKDNCLYDASSEKFTMNDLDKVSKCFIEGAIESNKENPKFTDKLEKQFEGETKAKKLFCHINWLWAFAASDMKGETKNSFPFKEFEGVHVCQEFIIADNMGIGSANPRQQKYKEIKLLIYVIQHLWNKNDNHVKESVKDDIVKLINEDIKKLDDSEDNKYLKENLPIKNALLYLCKPDEYEPIFSHNHKNSICKAFEWILTQDKNEEQNKDNKLRKIRGKLTDEYRFDAGFSFYDDGIRELWQIDDKKFDNLDEVQLLEYKQAMVLYGPPGTSKTYSAINLAILLVARCIIKLIAKNENSKNDELKKQLGTLLSKDKKAVNNVLKKYVDRLQMHINYNYEDFVAGQVIEGNNIVAKKGYIFDVIKKAEEKKNIPYVVILDEINRTDISRVFGEVFSAMEYRGDEIKLPLKDTDGNPISLCIPENLYFIGTMNEIDFSLERIDFALRRRFVWVLKTFESSRLKAILMEMPDSQKDENKIEDYCKQCEALNNVIRGSELGDNYVIGHAFFADIHKILDRFEGTQKWEKAKRILWQISIRPIIEAYCGSMDKSERNKLLNDCAEKLGLSIDDNCVKSKKNDSEEKQ